MKKILFFTFFLCLSMALRAQENAEIKKYRCENGWELWKDSFVTLGKPRGNFFSYITETPLVNADRMLSKNYAGSVVKIKQIVICELPSGKKLHYAVIETKEGKFYMAIEGAISGGELIVPDSYSEK